MRTADSLLARMGKNIAESAGATADVTPNVGALPGVTADRRYQGVTRIKGAMAVPLEQLIPDPEQPRKEFEPEALRDLAESLKARGQLQPCRVRWSAEASRWVIVVGERRYRAAIMAGLPTLLCIESTTPQSADDILEDQLVENALREDLKPVEQAIAFRTLMDRRGWSTRQLGDALSISAAHVTRTLALLTLPAEVQAKVTAGELPAATAYEVSKVEDPDQQRQLAERITSEGLSRDEAVEEVRKVAPKAKGRGASKAKAKGKPARLPAELKHRGARGCRVVVHTAARHSIDDAIADLEEFLGRLKAERDGDQQAA